MGRLKTTKPRLKATKPRVGFKDSSAPDGARQRRPHYHRWYSTARWKRLREEVFVRDNYICQQTGVLLKGQHPAEDSPVADHIIEHRGDPDLFWDKANLQSVSKAWHDKEKQKIEHARRYVRDS